MTNLDLNNSVESNMSEFTKSGSKLTGGSKIKRGGLIRRCKCSCWIFIFKSIS